MTNKIEEIVDAVSHGFHTDVERNEILKELIKMERDGSISAEEAADLTDKLLTSKTVGGSRLKPHVKTATTNPSDTYAKAIDKETGGKQDDIGFMEALAGKKPYSDPGFGGKLHHAARNMESQLRSDLTAKLAIGSIHPSEIPPLSQKTKPLKPVSGNIERLELILQTVLDDLRAHGECHLLSYSPSAYHQGRWSDETLCVRISAGFDNKLDN